MKKKRINSRSWQLILPLDFPVKEIQEKIKLLCKNYYFIRHDRDLDDFGKLKKEHWHALFTFSSPRCLDTLQNDFKGFPQLLENSYEKIQFITGAKKYLCHAEHPNKAQYDCSEVETNDEKFKDLFVPEQSRVDETKYIISAFMEMGHLSFGEFLNLFQNQFVTMNNYQRMSMLMQLRRYYADFWDNKTDLVKNDNFDRIERDECGLPKNDVDYDFPF